MQRGRAGRERDGVRRTDDRGELLLEEVETRSDRRDPVGLKRVEHMFDLGLTDVRR